MNGTSVPPNREDAMSEWRYSRNCYIRRRGSSTHRQLEHFPYHNIIYMILNISAHEALHVEIHTIEKVRHHSSKLHCIITRRMILKEQFDENKIRNNS